MPKSISNEDILELLQESIQMTSENFDRLEFGQEKTHDKVEALQTELEASRSEIKELKNSSLRHELESGNLTESTQQIYNEISAIRNDISEMLSRLNAIDMLLKQKRTYPHNLQQTLQEMLDQIKAIAKKEGINLKSS